jgi:hypothetical protein
MTGKVSRCLALRREHGSGPCRDVTDRPFAWKFHPGGRLPSLVVHFIRVLRVDLRPDPWGHLCQLGLAWPLFKINIYVAFSLALQARIAHGCQPALRLAIIFKPPIFHRLMMAFTHIVQDDPRFFIARHGKTHTIGTTFGGHMTTSTGITYIAELAQFNF